MQNYIEIYAKTFNLTYNKNKNACLNIDGSLLVFCDDENHINYLNEKSEWAKCRLGDLMLCVMNNVSLHCSEACYAS